MLCLSRKGVGGPMVWELGSHSRRHVRVLKDLPWVKSVTSQVWTRSAPLPAVGL